MENLRKQVRRARRRLILQSLIGKLAWCWFVTLFLCVIAIAVGKFWPITDTTTWAIGSASVALAVGALAAVAWTWLARHDALSAALEIDRRFELKERVSSTLALDADQLDSQIGQALVRDAAERLQKIDVGERFGVRLDRRALLPLLPAAAAFLVALGIDGNTSQAPAATTTAEKAQVKKSTELLAKKLEEKRKQAKEAGANEETDALLKELQERTAELAGKEQTDRKKTLVELNDLVKNAEARREKIASAAQLKEQFNQLKSLEQGPAQKLGQALKAGDLQKAVEEINKLKQQLGEGKLSEEAKEALARQINELKEAMEKKGQAQRQAEDELKKEVERQRKAGNNQQADKLQQQLDKLAQQGPQRERLEQMAAQLKQAGECMKKGQCDQAADALGQLGEELAKMQQESDELETLDDALADVADAKDAMNCEQCDGAGCEACQGDGNAMRRDGRGMSNSLLPGTGRGTGLQADLKNNTNLYDTQVRQNVKKGAVVVEGTADGPNRKGQVQEAIQSEFASAPQETAEALSGQRLPHEYRDHAKKYFDTLRKGQP